MGGEGFITLFLAGSILGLCFGVIVGVMMNGSRLKRLAIGCAVFIVGLVAPTAVFVGIGLYYKWTQPQPAVSRPG